MMMLTRLGLALAVFAAVSAYAVDDDNRKHQGDLWAVLVAGSATWFNYRHQADVCHAYQILKEHGVPDEHIIVMMMDDIAENEMNPNKGVIINRPDGPNVYEGVPKDYTGKDVTPQNLLKLLSGADMSGIGSGKSLMSGPKDRVFLNLVDHGAPGIFGFPAGFLNATALASTIQSMHHDKLFKEMVIYLESCESGSMFDKLLPDDINVYALTASNSTYSSFACYFDKSINNFLGDVFSIKWMEDSDKEDLSSETLKEQYTIVKKETTTSPVQQFGQVSIAKEVVGEYQGKKSTIDNSDIPPFHDACASSAISSPNVPVALMEQNLVLADTEEEHKEAKDAYVQFHKNREFVRDVVRKIALTVTSSATLTETITAEDYVTPITNMDCYDITVEHFHNHCFNLGYNPYALRHVKAFSSLCEHGFTTQAITSAMTSTCTHPDMININ